MVLTGCDSASENNRAALRAADEASRRTASAGTPHATDALMEQVAKAPNIDDLKRTLESRAKSNDKLADVLVQHDEATDLRDAVKKLQDGINLDPTPVIKSGLEAQLGATLLALSEAQAQGLHEDVAAVIRQSLAVQSLAQSAVDLLNRANVLDKAATASSADTLNKAKDAVAKGQAAVAAAQAKVTALQSDIAGKESQAQKIYTDTDAAFQAAESQKGNTGIAAGRKAMDDRKAAEELTAEAARQAPMLAQAQVDLAMRQIELSNAQKDQTFAQAALEQGNATAQQAKSQAQSLRDAAAKLVADKDGVKDQLEALVATAAKLDKEVKDAAGSADLAAGSYIMAMSDYRKFQSELRDKIEPLNLDTSDPLQKIAKDERASALLMWSQSAANQQSGRVKLAAADALGAADIAARVAVQAKAAAKTDIPDAKAYRTQATETFTKAVQSAGFGTGIDVDKMKWIGKSLEATANYGLYLSTNSPRALDAALQARNDAATRNPLFGSAPGQQLSWIQKAQ